MIETTRDKIWRRSINELVGKIRENSIQKNRYFLFCIWLFMSIKWSQKYTQSSFYAILYALMKF